MKRRTKHKISVLMLTYYDFLVFASDKANVTPVSLHAMTYLDLKEPSCGFSPSGGFSADWRLYVLEPPCGSLHNRLATSSMNRLAVFFTIVWLIHSHINTVSQFPTINTYIP